MLGSEGMIYDMGNRSIFPRVAKPFGADKASNTLG